MKKNLPLLLLALVSIVCGVAATAPPDDPGAEPSGNCPTENNACNNTDSCSFAGHDWTDYQGIKECFWYSVGCKNDKRRLCTIVERRPSLYCAGETTRWTRNYEDACN